MVPVVHGLEVEYFGRIQFVYLDIDDPRTMDFKRQFGFRYQPEFRLLDGEGQVVQTWLGRVSAEEFRAAFNRLLSR